MKFKEFLKRHSKFFGLLIAILFLYLAFRNTNFSAVWENLKKINIIFVLIAIIGMYMLFFMKVVRWQIILKPMKEIKFRKLYHALMIGYFIHNILPFRMGEFMRGYYLKKREDISQTSVVGSVFAEKIFDGLSLLVIAFITLVIGLGIEETKIIKVVRLLIIFIIISLILYYVMSKMSKKTSKFFKIPLFSILKNVHYKRFMGHFKRFKEGFKSLDSPGIIFLCLVTSLLIWFCDALSIYFLFLAFGVKIPNMLLMTLIPLLIINLGVIIPNGPGDTGAFHYFGILAYNEVLKLDISLASSIIILLHFIYILPGFTIGAFYMFKEHVKINIKEIKGE